MTMPNWSAFIPILYKLTRHEPYAQVVKEILGFISREMTSAESGFYSAIDADSEGAEGTFYVWDYDVFKRILDEDERFYAGLLFC